MVDKVKPIKIEDGEDIDFTECNPSEDYLSAKGVALSDSDNHLIHTADNEIAFDDPVNSQKKVSELLTTFENLDANSDVGTGSDQVAKGDHTHASGNNKSFLTFGDTATTGTLAAGLLKNTGNNTLGYALTSPVDVTAMSVLTDISNSNTYRLFKNGVSLQELIFASQTSKIVDGIAISFLKGDVLTTDFISAGSVYDEAYSPDGNTLFLANFDGDNETYRHVTNSSTIAKGMSGRLKNGASFTTTKKFGTHSVNFDGSNDRLEILHHDDYDVQDCTIEFWFRPDATSGDMCMFAKDRSDYGTGGHIYIGQYNDTIWIRSQTASSSKEIEFDPNLQANTWYHMAVVMGTGGIKVFLDGVLKGSDGSWTQGLNGNREPIVVGASNYSNTKTYYDNINYHFNGKIDELRISKTRRYETGFTPATGPFTNDANTLGLWHFDEGSGTLAYDSSDTIHNAMMMAGGSMCDVQTSVKKFGTHAIKLNGSRNDWLRFNHTSDYETSEGTVEGWIYPHADCYDGVVFQKGTSSTEGGLEIKWKTSGDKLQVTYYGASTSRSITTDDYSFEDGQWNHFAVTIDANYLKVYVNAELHDTKTLTGDYANVWLNNKEDVYIGANHNRQYYAQTYIDEFRISDVVRTYGGTGVSKISLVVEME